MVLERLGSKLKETLSKIAKAMFVDEHLINEAVKDMQRALLEADVNVNLVFDLTSKIKERAVKEKLPAGVTQKEHLIKIVYEELIAFLGKERKELKITKKPFKIMFVGIFGCGKTTTIAKLANYYKKRGYKVAMLGLDTHRPAAPEQLKQLSDKINVDCFVDKDDPIKVYEEYKEEIDRYDVVLIDTAGRAALDTELIEELNQLNKTIKPDENVLVMAADIGQAAQKQAEEFHRTCGITSVIITRLDGTAKAGGALTACAVTGAPVLFIGVGEKIDDIEVFNPTGFVSRLLGMGDIEALLEKVRGSIEEEKAKDLGKKFLKGDFSLLDMYEQIEAMKKMGPLTKIIELIPGFGGLKLPKELFDAQEDKLKKWNYMMQSMTKEELEKPEIICGRRIERIAKGSGTTTSEVKELVKYYKMIKKFTKQMQDVQEGRPEDLLKKLKKVKFKRI